MNRFKGVGGRDRVGRPNRRAIFEDRANYRRVETKNGIRRGEMSKNEAKNFARFGADI